MTDSDDRIARILEAVASIDLLRHPFWQVVKTLHAKKSVWPDGVIAADVNVAGESFSVESVFGLYWGWDDDPQGMNYEDFMFVIVTGRFEGDRAIARSSKQ